MRSSSEVCLAVHTGVSTCGCHLLCYCPAVSENPQVFLNPLGQMLMPPQLLPPVPRFDVYCLSCKSMGTGNWIPLSLGLFPGEEEEGLVPSRANSWHMHVSPFMGEQKTILLRSGIVQMASLSIPVRWSHHI